MKLKCIGGPFDGAWWRPALDATPGNLVAVVMGEQTAAYIVDESFLRYHEMSTNDAIRYQFRK